MQKYAPTAMARLLSLAGTGLEVGLVLRLNPPAYMRWNARKGRPKDVVRRAIPDARESMTNQRPVRRRLNGDPDGRKGPE